MTSFGGVRKGFLEEWMFELYPEAIYVCVGYRVLKNCGERPGAVKLARLGEARTQKASVCVMLRCPILSSASIPFPVLCCILYPQSSLP